MSEIVPAHLAVQAMRDNGYKNAAYALAELMDNSIQADATKVELLCVEKEVQLLHRRVSRLDQIGVLDNGSGMDKNTLKMALQFGNGMYIDPIKHTGIGRFGMGLPASSISQCTRVDVWTWQNGINEAIHSYLDLKLIREKQQTSIPEPDSVEIPELWREIGSVYSKNGTLVVWSNLDRCVWRTAKSIIDNSEFLIGRMYRRFLEDDRVTIRMVSYNVDDPGSLKENFAKPNDPGYLMRNTSCPEPFNIEPMFQKWGDENFEASLVIDFRDKQHEVKIRFSYAKEEARKGVNPGSLPHGQHAARNVGVSIMRAERELDLDQSWVIKYDPVERWWGIEIEFPPSLDDLFGVTNNKQSARNFGELVKLNIETLLQGGKSITALKEELMEEEDPRGPMVEIAQKIESQLRVLRGLLRSQTKGRRSRKRYEKPSAEEVATAITRERQKEGYIGVSDKDETLPADERKGIIERSLIDDGTTKDSAEELASRALEGLKYLFAYADLETPAFFSVKPRGGAIIITLNTNHPAYQNLLEILEEENEDATIETLKSRLANSLQAIKLLLTAWARYEDEQPDGILRSRAQETRTDWGRIARRFLEQEE